MRPPGGPLMDGVSPGLVGRLTCHCLAIETDGDGVVLVEWPDRLEDLAPEDALRIRLTPLEGEARRATLRGWPGRIERLSP